jgi:hypothetical protein
MALIIFRLWIIWIILKYYINYITNTKNLSKYLFFIKNINLKEKYLFITNNYLQSKNLNEYPNIGCKWLK